MWYIILGVVGAALTLVLHELSHCIVVWADGGRVLSFKPWPHMVDGRFFFGRMTYDTRYPPHRKIMLLAPFLKAQALFMLWFGLGWVWHPLWVLAGWEATDWINWLQGYIRRSRNDGGQFRSLP